MKRSTTLRHVGLAYIAFAVIATVREYDPIYQAMFAVMATVAVVGSEILKELGR